MEKPLRRILIVDDSPEDRAVYRRYLESDSEHRYEFVETDSGLEGIDLCRRHLPGTDGRAVLAEIKAAAGLSEIPVVVLTTSADHRDVEACYQAGANSYVQKPVNLDAFMVAIQRLHDYWFDVVILPHE